MAGTCITSFVPKMPPVPQRARRRRTDFNTTVVSPMHVFRSYPSTSSSFQARSGYTSAPSETSSYDRASFLLQFFDNLSKCVQFVKETRPTSENYFRKQIVHE